MGEFLSRAHYKEKVTNRNMLLNILRCVRFLAQQDLPLRGVGSDADSNLRQVLLLQCVDNLDLGAWLRKKTDKYTSHNIQNEMLKIMAVKILRQISQRIRDGERNTILADESMDVANKEQFTICIWW